MLQAWYPGARGGEAIARVLFGEVNPSGRLPISFPRDVADLVRPEIPGMIFGPPVEGKTLPTSFPNVQRHKGRFSVPHPERADAGYRWFAAPSASARRSGRRAPMSGTMSSPCAATQAMATWTGVAFRASAKARSFSTRPRLWASASPWKRGLWVRKSPASGCWRGWGPR